MIDSALVVLQRSVKTGARRCVAISLSLIAALSAGCSDYRMSLADFLAQQRQRCQQVSAPSAEESLAVRKLLDRQLGPYRVGPSDVLLVTFTSVEEVALLAPLNVRVNREGEIDLPLVGRLNVSGFELQDVDATIKKAYVPTVFRDAVVHTNLVSTEPTTVVVRGAVTLPGMVPLRRTEANLLFAVIGAGGVSELASGTVSLRRVRRPMETVTLDLTNPTDLHAAMALDPLENGDIVTVHTATPNTVFVGGLVNTPHAQVYGAGVKMNVLQALAAAGGLRTDITPKEGTLIRHMPDGKDAHVKLDLTRIASGLDPNLMLEPGDILWVPHTFDTRIQEFISQNIFLRGGITATYSVTGLEFMNRSNLQSFRGTGPLEDSFDPFGFLTRGSALSALSTAAAGS